MLELTNLLRLGRRDSLEAFIGRSYDSQTLAARSMAGHLNFYQEVMYLARGAERIGTRNTTPSSASAYWYSPLLEDWYGITIWVDSVAPHRVGGIQSVVRVHPPENVPGPARAKSPQAAWQSLDAWVKRLADADRFSGTSYRRGSLTRIPRELTDSGQERWRSDRYLHRRTAPPRAAGGRRPRTGAIRRRPARQQAAFRRHDRAHAHPKPELSSPNYGFGTQIFPTANQVGHTGSGPGTAARVQFDKTTGRRRSC